MRSEMMDALRVDVDRDPARGRFSLVGDDTQVFGEVTFRRARDDLIIIDQTQAVDSLNSR